MIKKLSYLISVLLITAQLRADNKIIFYFNHPVDTSVAHGVKAMYLNHCMADTLVAYLNRAQYSIDIAQYNYGQGNYANIATAVNNAYARGVKVRWIYNGSSTNSGLTQLNHGINVLGSPTTSSYNIMHNKFVIIDAEAPDSNNVYLISGSPDWSTQQFNTDYNNLVIIQSRVLARAYKAEFNEMWGDTGTVPNLNNSRFGQFKTDLGQHVFTIDGKTVELYFSPSDHTNAHIQSTIASANTDLYFGVYTFTDNNDANMIVAKKIAGVYVAGIIDEYSDSYQPYQTFMSGLDTNFILYTSTGLYHNKYMIVDPNDTCADPVVLTGSHNWTISADTKNDENTLIIHSASAANIYYQAFHKDFTSSGGRLAAVSGCTTGVTVLAGANDSIKLYPNPSNGNSIVSYHLNKSQTVRIDVYNVFGQHIMQVIDNIEGAGAHEHSININRSGTYMVQIMTGQQVITKRIVTII